jgi:mycothiol synthase
VVQDSEGALLATAPLELDVGPQRSFARSYPVVHPLCRGSSAERLLLEGLWQLARDHWSELTDRHSRFLVHCGAHQEERTALYEALGLRLMRQRPHMLYHPLESLPGPQAPPGIQLRPYVRGTDDKSAVQTLNEAFAADWEYVPVTEDQWSRWLDAPQWSADLCLVAADGDELVGLCLCLVDEDRIQWLGRKDGYVDTLCVRPCYQRKGVGRALLLYALEALHAAGMVSATLDTDEDNLTQAPRFYRQLGFREAWRWVAYGTELK